MTTRRHPLAVAAAVAWLGSWLPLGAVGTAIDNLAIDRAIEIARGNEAARAAFHRPYTIPLGGTYERVEVISEFRQVVMTAEERLAVDRRWARSQARAALAPFRGLVTFVVWVRFPPQNVLVTAPNYNVVVYPEGTATPEAEANVLRSAAPAVMPLFAAGGGQALVGPPGSAMSGLRVAVTFPAEQLRLDRSCTVAILLEGEEQARVELDLGRLR